MNYARTLQDYPNIAGLVSLPVSHVAPTRSCTGIIHYTPYPALHRPFALLRAYIDGQFREFRAYIPEAALRGDVVGFGRGMLLL